MATIPDRSTYIEIPILTLREETTADFDLYILHPKTEAPVLFRQRQQTTSRDFISRLQEHNHVRLYVRSEQQREYQRYVEKLLDTVLADPNVEMQEKVQVLYSSASGLMKNLFEDPDSSDLLERTRGIAAPLTNYLAQEERAFHHLLKLVSYDYYTYTHSVNVFAYSVFLCQRAGLSDPTTLREFGEGLLLHDIGKCRVDPGIVNSKARLSDDQIEQIRMHPVLGYDMMKNDRGLSDLALQVIRSHHEKMDGTGYPDGLAGDEIPPLIRVATIADVFDALTTRRSYRDALSTYKAFDLMREQLLNGFDRDLFRLFITMFTAPDE